MAIKQKINGISLIEMIALLAIYSIFLTGTLEFSSNIILQYKTHQAHYHVSSKAKTAYLLLYNMITYAKPNDSQKILTGQEGQNDTLTIFQSPVSCSGQTEQNFYNINIFIDTPASTSQSSMYCKKNKGNKQEIIDGVEAMKIRYVLEKNHQIYYQNSEQINNWEDVRRVEISLIFSEPRPMLVSSQSIFNLFGSEKIFNRPTQLYRQYTFAFNLKNK